MYGRAKLLLLLDHDEQFPTDNIIFQKMTKAYLKNKTHHFNMYKHCYI